MSRWRRGFPWLVYVLLFLVSAYRHGLAGIIIQAIIMVIAYLITWIFFIRSKKMTWFGEKVRRG